MYLRYVLDELRLGLRSVGDIMNAGRSVGLLRREPDEGNDDPAWGRVILPLLATLAAAAEPLPVRTLTRLSGLPDPHPVHELCARRLRPFLTLPSTKGADAATASTMRACASS